MLEHLWSDADAGDHFRNSRVEFLKGIRSLIDDRIAHLSRRRTQRHARHRGVTRPARGALGTLVECATPQCFTYVFSNLLRVL